MTPDPRWTYAIAQAAYRPYRPSGSGRHFTPPRRPVDGVVAIFPHGFDWMGEFDAAIAPARWGVRATLDEATIMAIGDAGASDNPAIEWTAWNRASNRAARARVVEAWYAWICERWPIWRQRVAETSRPPTVTIPEMTGVSQSNLPDRSVVSRVGRNSLVIGRPGDRGRWRPIGPAKWLPAGTWPAVVRFRAIAQVDGSWASEVHPVSETPGWPPTPLMLPGGPADLHTWAECLREIVAADRGIAPHTFWTGCWNSLAGLPALTGIRRDPQVPGDARVPRVPRVPGVTRTRRR